MGREWFPLHPYVETYEQAAAIVYFDRQGWGPEDLHELDRPVGELLLLALVASPYDDGGGWRAPLLEACEAYVPRALLRRIPDGGWCPQELHTRLDGTPYVAAGEFAGWVWGDTGTPFLDMEGDYDGQIELPWSLGNAEALRELWRHASEIKARCRELGLWLEGDPPGRLGLLLGALQSAHEERRTA